MPGNNSFKGKGFVMNTPEIMGTQVSVVQTMVLIDFE